MNDYPVSYCCSYRLGSGETVEDFLQCIDLAAALEKAQNDVRNKPLCESVFFMDDDISVKFTLDDYEEVSGKYELKARRLGISHSYHIDDFCAIPLGQIDHANRQVFLNCYKELAALWDTDPSIKNAFLVLAENDYDNIMDFIGTHCNFNNKMDVILREFYGSFRSLEDHKQGWCERYFGGFFRRDFDPHGKITHGRDNSEVPF